MTYHLVNWGMTVAVLFFGVGYAYRKKDLRLHRLFMASGVGLTLLGALVLLVSVYVIHGGDREAAGFLPAAPNWVILTHRIIASVTFVTMFVMVWSGATRRRSLHVTLHRWFIPLYLVVYVSGLIVFKNN